MNKQVLIILAIISTVVLSACGLERVDGSGNIVEDERESQEFDSIRIESSATVNIEQGDDYSVVVEADDNVQQYVIVSYSGDTLVLETQNNLLMVNVTLIYNITVPDLETIEVNSFADVFIDDFESNELEIVLNSSGDISTETLELDELDITNTGSGSILIEDIDSERATISMDGSGDVTIEDGTIEELTVEVSGSGDYDSESVDSDIVIAETTSSGSITVHANNSLDATISGSGDINFAGNADVDLDDNGSGDLVTLDNE